jgi:3-hydroxyacyl-[acyl-carrier-protein] dehydratase
MASKDLIFDISQLDFDKPIADIEAIRKVNPQRFDMEHLTAVVYEDLEEFICVGYKDLGDDEFWIPGHMPGMPLMPGVIQLEAMAQLCSYFVQKNDLLGADMLGFGGLEDVRFRDPVRPGDRLVLMGVLTKLRRRRMCVCRFQCLVGDSVVCEGAIKGIPLPLEALQQMSSQ